MLVSGGFRVAVSALRAIEGDTSAGVQLGGAEDAHFVRADHWLVSDKPLPAQGWQWVDLAVALKNPSAATKREGQFMRTGDGWILWTAHAHRTRPATQADLKVGGFAFMPHVKKNSVYGAPSSRKVALGSRWWVARIVDTSELYKGVVTVAGNYKVATKRDTREVLRTALPRRVCQGSLRQIRAKAISANPVEALRTRIWTSRPVSSCGTTLPPG